MSTQNITQIKTLYSPVSRGGRRADCSTTFVQNFKTTLQRMLQEMHAKPQLSVLLSMKVATIGLHKSWLCTNRSNLSSPKTKKKRRLTIILLGWVFFGQADLTRQIMKSKAGSPNDFSSGRLSQTVISFDPNILCDNLWLKHRRQETVSQSTAAH